MQRRTIDSPSNPTLKAAIKLRERRGRETQGRIIIEGWREVTRARQSGVTLEQVFLAADDEPGQQRTSEWDVELVGLGARAFEKLTFGNRTEVVATARTPEPSLEELVLPGRPALVVLDGIEKPGNVGAVLRSADGAGMDAVIVVDGGTDLYNPNTIRASLGTIFSRPIATACWDDYLRWADERPLQHYAARCEQATVYTDVDWTEPCAMVLGSESAGLGERWREVPGVRNVTLPMLGMADSLNVSAAASVLCYEVLRQRRQP